MIGKTLGHYRIEAPLGSGGMGVVYRARDLHLERDVALKVLRESTLADETARKRFRREALALSKLSHPHVATVFDFDHQKGIDFLVMELVAGEPLDQRLARGALPEPEATALTAQIVEALAAAHALGVVHRDLKPANIVVSPEHQVKVLDFGLAQLVRPAEATDLTRTMTEVGVAVGTVPYMAPEQLLGRRVDARADLYALGVVLYEMVTGRSPYRERVATALVYEIVNQPPPPPRAVAPQVSERLEAIILRCLAKDPDDRYPSATALSTDLRDSSRPSTAPAPGSKVPPPLAAVRFLPAAVTFLIVLLAGVLVLNNSGGIRERLFGGGHIDALAVLPLENLSRDPEQEFFADGMTDELITRLARVAALRVISRTSVMQYKGTTKRLPQIARELHVQAIVEGSVMRQGDRTRISAKLIRAANDQNLWADSFEGDLRNVFSLQSQVAQAIVAKVQANLTTRERAVLAAARPVDPEVNEAVLKGRYFVNRFDTGDWQKALDSFKRAISLDPTHAPAHAGLAGAYLRMSATSISSLQAMPKAKAAAIEALQLDPGNVEARNALAYVKAFYDWDWGGAELEFRRVIDLSPGDATAHGNYGEHLVMQQRFDEASAEIAKALAIDPLSTYFTTVSLWPLFEGRRYDRAIAQCERMLQEDSTLTFVHMILGQSLLMSGKPGRAIAELRAVAHREQTSGFVPAWLGKAFVAAGQPDSARAILSELERQRERAYVAPYALMLLYAALDERDRAFFWLDQAIEDRATELCFLKTDPGLDPLRSDPRFAVALRKVGFSP